MTALQEVLLVIVAFATFLLLVFTIVALVLAMVILKRIKIVVDRAKASTETVAEIVEEVKETLANPTTVAGFIQRLINRNRRKNSGRK